MESELSYWNSGTNNRGGRFFHGGGRGNRGYRGGGRSYRGMQQRGNRGFRGGNRPQFYNNPNQNQRYNRPKRDVPTKRLSEDEIGVTEYISDHEGFLGIIKSRYSDFQVSEISDRGEIAKLTDLSPPTPPEEETVTEDEELLVKYNLELLSTEVWDQINELAVNPKPKSETVEIDVTGESKEQRTKIHDAVKKAFGDGIVGSTVTVDDKKIVRFQKYRKGVRIDNRVKWIWPGEYVYFVVHKENCDTMEAAAKIAERLRLNLKPTMLGYAGTKDRRAKTSQWFSLRKVDPKKISSACEHLRDIWVGNFTFRDHQLRLGMLSGNQFRIALRNVTASDESIDAACKYLKEKGFINYYGLQRFGTRIEIPTYKIGLKLLQGNMKEAIDCILAEREGPIQEVLSLYNKVGASQALSRWPRRAPHSQIEHRLIKALAQSPKDLIGALDKLARNTRLLYLHSYQSLVWNHAVSERIRRFGLVPAVGDLVPLGVGLDEEIEVIDLLGDDDDDDSESNTSSNANDSSQDGGEQKMAEQNKMADENKMADQKQQQEPAEFQKKIPVKALTQEDVDNNKYSIFDIIMPLPGYTVEYPPNIKDFYEEFLTKDGLTLEMKHKHKCYRMSGAYRHMVVRPVNMSWSRVGYDDPHTDLQLSDFDNLKGRQLNGIVTDGKYKALLVTLTLPASCYATMALRELLKVDTSCDNQALQNNYHKKQTDKQTDEQTVKTEDVEVKVEVMEEGDSSQGEKRKIDDDGDVDAKKIKHEIDE